MDGDRPPDMNYYEQVRRIKRKPVNLRPAYHPNLGETSALIHNHEPSNVYPPEPVCYPEPMASIPLEPEKPIGSDHSSDDDNREYFQLLSYRDDSESDSFYEPNTLRHVLNINKELISALRTKHWMAEQHSESMKGMYFKYLEQVKTTYGQRKHNGLPYPLDDWVKSTLYLFPRDRFWMGRTNELLDGECTTDFYSFL